MKGVPALLILSLLAVPNTAALGVAPECQVRVLQPLTDDLGNHWQPGHVLPVTIERDNADGGAYCAHGGSCLPRKMNGHDSVKLMNCRIGEAIGGGDHRLSSTKSPATNK